MATGVWETWLWTPPSRTPPHWRQGCLRSGVGWVFRLPEFSVHGAREAPGWPGFDQEVIQPAGLHPKMVPWGQAEWPLWGHVWPPGLEPRGPALWVLVHQCSRSRRGPSRAPLPGPRARGFYPGPPAHLPEGWVRRGDSCPWPRVKGRRAFCSRSPSAGHPQPSLQPPASVRSAASGRGGCGSPGCSVCCGQTRVSPRPRPQCPQWVAFQPRPLRPPGCGWRRALSGSPGAVGEGMPSEGSVCSAAPCGTGGARDGLGERAAALCRPSLAFFLLPSSIEATSGSATVPCSGSRQRPPVWLGN